MKLRNQTILVTGGAGFIGSHLCEALVKENRVLVYDNYSSAVVPFREARGIKGDILDQQKLDVAMRGVDIVFHLAVACVRLSLGSPRHVHDVNATGTLTTLLAAKKTGVKRFIYISSSEVYGTAQQSKIDEGHPINPTTVYGMSKYMGEEYTRLFHTHEGLPSIIIRPFNTYGPRSHFEGVYGEVIPRFCLRALSGKLPIIYGTGRQTRDFTYITDTVGGIIKAAQSDKLLGDTINIAFGKELSIAQIARHVCFLTNLPYHPDFLPARPNDVARHRADISKAKKVFNYHPNVSIEEGLTRYVSWIKQTYKDPKKLLKLIPEKNW